jgi:hypothetical protein
LTTHLQAKALTNAHDPALGSITNEWPSYLDWGTGKFVNTCRFRNHTLYEGPEEQVHIHWALHNVFIENVQRAAYWATQVKQQGCQALFVPHVLGKLYSKAGKMVTLISDNQVLELQGVPGFSRAINMLASSPAAAEARLNSVMKEQVKDDLIRTEMYLRGWLKTSRLHDQLTLWQRRDFAQHQRMINEARKRDATTTTEMKHRRFSLFFVLRTSRFPYIRCQANLGVGAYPDLGLTKNQRSVYLQQAIQEVAQLQRDHPNDQNVSTLRQHAMDAWNRNRAEV